MTCRFCSAALTHQFVDLVNSPPSNDYLSAEDLNAPEVYLPLKLFVCDQCLLVQIDEYRKANQLFSKEYAYFSSYSTSWLAHSKRYTDEMINRFGFSHQSLVVEIASNDGYLLQYFKECNVPVLGIEPTESTAAVARQKGIETLTEFFGVNFAHKMVKQKGKADLLLGNNVLAHVPDINDFVGGMKIGLKEQGIITMEFPHLLQLVWNNQFDTIYHEHFSYLSFSTVKKIFTAHGLEMFDVQEIPTHGGSLRIFARHEEDQSKSVLPTVNTLLQKEKEAGITTSCFYDGFQEKVNRVKIDFLKFLVEKKKENKKVIAYGAAAKGNTLLNYCGVRHDLINFVVDASPYKQGKFLPGSHIPVVNESRIKEMKPDYIIIFPWNIKEEILNQLSYVKGWGCKFVVAIPQIEIIES